MLLDLFALGQAALSQPVILSSSSPLLQDGSCNGLQHYAALGRDIIGATSVNLKPCDEPQDVYSGVAQQVSGCFSSLLWAEVTVITVDLGPELHIWEYSDDLPRPTVTDRRGIEDISSFQV